MELWNFRVLKQPWWSSCPPVFGCYRLSNVHSVKKNTKRSSVLLLCLVSLFTERTLSWFFSRWERKNYLKSWANSQNDNHFYSKRQTGNISSENSCHIVNLLSFESSSFFPRLRKIHTIFNVKLQKILVSTSSRLVALAKAGLFHKEIQKGPTFNKY